MGDIEINKSIVSHFLIRLIVILVLIVATIFVIKKCDNNYSVSDKKLQMVEDSMFKEEIKGIVLDAKKSIILENESDLKKIFSKNDSILKILSSLKNVKSVTIINNNATLLKDSIVFSKDSIPCDFTPFKISKKDTNYYFAGTISKKQLMIDTFNIPNKLTMFVGDKKVNFWGKKETRIYALNSNPLVKNTDIQNLIVVEKKKWYERPIFWIATTALTTISLIKKWI